MTRRYYYTIELLTAGILIVTALTLLLIPNRQMLFEGAQLHTLLITIAVILFLVSLSSLTALMTGLAGTIRSIIGMVRTVAVLALAGLYLVRSLEVEAAALIGLAGAYPLALLVAEKKPRRPFSPLTLALAIVNLAGGIILLAQPADVLANYPLIAPYSLAASIVFFTTGLVGGITLLWPDLPPYLEQFSLIPWIIWTILAAIGLQVSQLIPALFLLFSYFLANRINWQKLIPSQVHPASRQLIPLIGITYVAITVFVSSQLNGIETLSTGDALAQFVQNQRDIAFILISALTMLLGHLMGIINFQLQKTAGNTQNLTVPNPVTRPILAGHDIESHETASRSQEYLEVQLRQLETQIEIERRRTAQLNLLQELRRQLTNQYDEPVIAQLAVNMLQRTFECSLATIFTYEQDRKELVAMAAAGPSVYGVPAGYRQSVNQGMIGRAVRLRKTQIANNTRLDPDFFQLESQYILSEVVVPIIHQGHTMGVLVVDYDKSMAFGGMDVATFEAVAGEVLQAWDIGSYQRHLTELIQAGVSLSSALDPQSAIREIAIIARQTLAARFAFVMLLDEEGHFSRTASAGFAPELMKCLSKDPSNHALVVAALNASGVFRVRDVRKYDQQSRLVLDHKRLQSFIGIPIRLHRLSIGAILAFGKQNSLLFSERDESLANLLSSQAAAAVESSWLYNELRTTMNTATLLYQLSFDIIQKDEMREKAEVIAATAHRIIQARRTGIVLFDDEGAIIANVEVDDKSTRSGTRPPMEMIQQSLESNQRIILAGDNDLLNICIPLSTSSRKHGALWFEIAEVMWYNSHQAAGLQTMSNQVAVALERASLLIKSQRQAKELERAFRELEITYDQTLTALMSALDARDRETEGHSGRVGQSAARLGKLLGLPSDEVKILERGSLLHDIGKIGIQDAILNKPGPLTDEEWEIMRTHPDIGAKIVTGIPFLEDTIPLIRFHQERWDGTGYPLGLKGEEIPLLARIFAAVDALDALTSIRPYRQKVSMEEALQYLHEKAGVLFDARIVNALDQLIRSGGLDDLIHE